MRAIAGSALHGPRQRRRRQYGSAPSKPAKGVSLRGVVLGAAIAAASLLVGDGASAVSSLGDGRDCGDFTDWNTAQVWFEMFQPEHGDVAHLDANGDGVACESLPGVPTATAARPSGGGYWMLAANGTVFGFGDAGPLAPLVRDAATAITPASGGGYWVLGASGAVHARGATHYGDAALFLVATAQRRSRGRRPVTATGSSRIWAR